ncbi:hypothetical protein [Arsukibacterium indicum]|uniref:Uncharacterized protein n=1 Tax=Arsukibacterium indicum TaxID=2848612 RepID=A0ABS6MHN1_9GAMM|nr:hypothetical protein [Arsukibacterium indicum]MBV2128317.1 hypothetical protein [Arsukibacterium indicum]
MVRQLSIMLSGRLLLLVLVAALSQTAMAESLLRTEKQYRLAAWHFYQDDYYQALLQLSMTAESPAKTSLLQAGLLLQLDMPAATARLLQQLLDDQTLSGKLPRQLRNVALLQYSRFLFEQQQSDQAEHYLGQLSGPLDDLSGEAELLKQLLNWPAINTADSGVFDRLAGHNELPYVVINQILALRQQQQPQPALVMLEQLNNRLQPETATGFWRQLFRWRWSDPLISSDSERQALADYLQLLQAGLLVDQLQWADAQQVLSQFASNSVLTLPAMILYRDVLTENRQIPSLLSVLQQLIDRYPYADASWLAAHQLGNQFERALAQQDALAAYRWADQYYQQQLTINSGHARPLTLSQLAESSGLSGWQSYQLRQQPGLFQLNSQLNALQQLQQLQQQRLDRLKKLGEVIDFKLAQQQQLLTSALPDLSARQQALQLQAEQLAASIASAKAEPMAMQLWLGDSEQNYAQLHVMLSKARGRADALSAAGRDVADAKQRLSRLEGILQWHYQYNRAQRHWQLDKQQQQLTAELARIGQALERLSRLDGKTERLLLQQQQLAAMTVQESQFGAALFVQQQQLLAGLNSGLEQIRLAEREKLLEMRRFNTQAIARVMEQLLLTSQEEQ